ncbi:unnamed protein product [Orchesella dallaii]|uniref:Uncharacterized protein n=1 Tax=Orchesella dallaii TaxID=48710 RepID=A0ABP1RIB4_9HEXA
MENYFPDWTPSTFLNIFQGCYVMQYIGLLNKPGWSLDLLQKHLSNHQTSVPAILDKIGPEKVTGRYGMTLSSIVRCNTESSCEKRKYTSIRSTYPKFSKSQCIVQNVILDKRDFPFVRNFLLMVHLETPHFANVITQNSFVDLERYQRLSPWPQIKSEFFTLQTVPILYLICDKKVNSGNLFVEKWFMGHVIIRLPKSHVESLKNLEKSWLTAYKNITRESLSTNIYALTIGSLFSFMTSEIPPIRSTDFVHLYNSSTVVCIAGTGNPADPSSLHDWANSAKTISITNLQNQRQYHDTVLKIPYCHERNLSSLSERIASHNQIQTPQGAIPIKGEIAIVSSSDDRNLIGESMKFLNFFQYKSRDHSMPYVWYRMWMVRKTWALLWRDTTVRVVESGIYGKWESNYEATKRINYLKGASKMWNSGNILKHNMESPYKTKNFFMWTHLAGGRTREGSDTEPIGMPVLVSVFELLCLCVYASCVGLICEVVIYHKLFMMNKYLVSDTV